MGTTPISTVGWISSTPQTRPTYLGTTPYPSSRTESATAASIVIFGGPSPSVIFDFRRGRERRRSREVRYREMPQPFMLRFLLNTSALLDCIT